MLSASVKPCVSRLSTRLLAALITTAGPAAAADDLAARFGARPLTEQASLSPDGSQIAYLTPGPGQGSAIYALKIEPGATPKAVAALDGDPQRLGRCNWVSNSRLACIVYGVVKSDRLLDFSRMFAVDVGGANPKMLSKRENIGSQGAALYGGDIIDWLPGTDNQVLMTRVKLRDDRAGSLVGSTDQGLYVDRLDTATLKATVVERPDTYNRRFISDGLGNVRIKGVMVRSADDYDSGITRYFYRPKGGGDWQKLNEYDRKTDEGFWPIAVDPDGNFAWGLKKRDGRDALVKLMLDGSGDETVVLARPDVDIEGLYRIGRQRRVVGATYLTDKRHVVYFDEGLAKLAASLARALPNQGLVDIVDASEDETKLLIWAGNDNDPGTYYLLDRTTKKLTPITRSREGLDDVRLAQVKPVSYPAADGTMIPGYLTLPAGSSGRNLPAIVLPHGGPSARDEWGFDWLSQFFAAKGYAVLQPNFRGSAGYGDAWLKRNGFKSWKTAIGDVQDAGRWLVKEGIADPAKLGIVGWSYGGYAALQSAVTDPGLFKAVVAIAPVTDLDMLKEEARYSSSRFVVADFIGGGPHIEEGSPARHAGRIKAPVLLFHGGLDTNVGIAQSRRMAEALKAAGVESRLVTWDKLDHNLEDSAARTQMLGESAAFLAAHLK
jgi:dipeptidyl aminopeptidase/acylaminoacyl peptidase